MNNYITAFWTNSNRTHFCVKKLHWTEKKKRPSCPINRVQAKRSVATCSIWTKATWCKWKRTSRRRMLWRTWPKPCASCLPKNPTIRTFSSSSSITHSSKRWSTMTLVECRTMLSLGWASTSRTRTSRPSMWQRYPLALRSCAPGSSASTAPECSATTQIM